MYYLNSTAWHHYNHQDTKKERNIKCAYRKWRHKRLGRLIKQGCVSYNEFSNVCNLHRLSKGSDYSLKRDFGNKEKIQSLWTDFKMKVCFLIVTYIWTKTVVLICGIKRPFRFLCDKISTPFVLRGRARLFNLEIIRFLNCRKPFIPHTPTKHITPINTIYFSKTKRLAAVKTSIMDFA